MGALSQHGLCLCIHSQLWLGTRWCDWNLKLRTLHPNCAASCMHDRSIGELAQFLHHLHRISICCGGAEAVLLSCVLGRLCDGGCLHILRCSRNQEQNLSGDSCRVPVQEEEEDTGHRGECVVNLPVKAAKCGSVHKQGNMFV